MTEISQQNSHDLTYANMLRYIIANAGDWEPNRTGIPTKSVFGYQNRYALRDGFPLLTSKKIHIKSVIYELLWFMRGDTNVKYLQENGVRIWDEWADDNGDLGPVYGSQWRAWETFDPMMKIVDGAHVHKPGAVVDQIANALTDLKKNPTSRRIIVSAWNPPQIPNCALPPCHLLFQFNTRPMTVDQRYHYATLRSVPGAEDLRPSELDREGAPKYFLDLQLYQRSADVFLGVPFNIASYAMLLHMMAEVVNMVPGDFVHTFGNLHIYQNHWDQVHKQLENADQGPFYASPKFSFGRRIADIDDFRYEDFVFTDYQSHETIRAKVAV